MNRDRLVSQLTVDEGLRLKPYRDTMGIFSIGIGRNLESVGISEAEARYMLDNDIDRVVRGLDAHVSWWRNLDDVRQEVLVNMGFNVGIAKLLKFEKMLSALHEGDFRRAAAEARDSLWYRQVPNRAKRLADALESGHF